MLHTTMSLPSSYGSPQTLDKSQMRVLYDPREGLFPTKDSIFFFHLDLTNSGDVANVLLCVYTAVVCVTVTDPFWTILQVSQEGMLCFVM